jgi:hypothetical protein
MRFGYLTTSPWQELQATIFSILRILEQLRVSYLERFDQMHRRLMYWCRGRQQAQG